MLKLKNSRACLCLLFLFIAPSFAIAQVDRRPPPPGHGYDDSSRVIRLERKVDELNRRLLRVENFLDNGGGGGGRPPHNGVHMCMLVDSGYSKTFLAEGKSQLDAEYNVRQKCAQTVSSSYCASGKLKCDNNYNSRGQGFMCVIRDTGYSRNFRGEGLTGVAAEASARISCQASVSASYCQAAARCEENY